MLDSKVLVECLSDCLGQIASQGVPLPCRGQGLFVQLHDLRHLIVQAIVYKAAP